MKNKSYRDLTAADFEPCCWYCAHCEINPAEGGGHAADCRNCRVCGAPAPTMTERQAKERVCGEYLFAETDLEDMIRLCGIFGVKGGRAKAKTRKINH